MEKKELNKDKEKLTFDEWKKLLFEFCNINHICATQREQYKNYNIGSWLQIQKIKINDINNEIYVKLSENKYVKKSLIKYLEKKKKNIDKEKLTFEQWKNLLFEFCYINHRCPTRDEQYKNYNIGMWLHITQKRKINDINNKFYTILSQNEYVKISLDEYLENIEKNINKVKLTFEQSKNLLFEFCNINYRCITWNEKYKNYNIGKWLQHQKEKINDINNKFYIILSENEYVKKSLDEYLHKKNKFIV